MSNERQYKTAIIGCGNIAGGYDASYQGGGDYVLTHAGAYQAHGGFDLVACVEPDQEKREAFQARWNIAHGFASMAELANSTLKLDVLSLCAPTAYHVADLTMALELSPRLVFAEKPLSNHVAASAKLVRAYEKQGISLAVNYFRQWDPVLLATARDVRDGEWGEFLNGTLSYSKGVLNNGSHFLNLARLFVGEMTPHSVVGGIADYNEEDPTITGLMSVDEGGFLFLAGGDARKYISTELELNFSGGRIAIEAMGMKLRLRIPEDNPLYAGYTWLSPPQERETGFAQGVLHGVSNIYQHLEDATPLLCTGEDALIVQTLAQDFIDLYKKGNPS